MKASVITLHTVDNYGSALQTYATQQILNSFGYDVEFVDYWRKDNLPKYRAEKMLESTTLRKFKPIWSRSNFIRKTTIFLLKKVLEKRKSPMWKFLEKNVQFTPERYTSFIELMEMPPIADVYITGSDQVWNSNWNHGIDRSYYLDFAPVGRSRISLSASIGVESLDSAEIPEMKELLKKYHAISVREQSAVDLLQSIGIKSTLILDPTLMLDAEKWHKLAAPMNRIKPYLLIYQLNPNSKMDDYAEQLAKRNGWEVVRIGFGWSDWKKSGECIMLPSIEEFLGLFLKASCILTDSFHATAFSLNLGIDFISVMPRRFSTRIENILNMTGCDCRALNNYNDFEILNKRIDRDCVQSILEHERERALDYLKEALS